MPHALVACAIALPASALMCSIAAAQAPPTDQTEVFPGMMSGAPVTAPPPAVTPASPPPLPPASAPPAAPPTWQAPMYPAPPPLPPPPPQPCAQEPEKKWLRDGFYLRLVNGISYLHLEGNGPAGTTSASGVGSGNNILIGGSLVPDLVLAVSFLSSTVVAKFDGGPYQDATITAGATQTDANDEATVSLSGIGGMLDWYPSRSMGFHVGLGGGFGVVSVSNLADGSNFVGVNQTVAAMVGYDSPIARVWALGLALTGSASSRAVLTHDKSGDKTGYDLTPWTVGIGASMLYF